jgi:DNA-binding MarR family transcriptional regulator
MSLDERVTDSPASVEASVPPKRRRRERGAALDPKEALETLLTQVHRLATTIGDADLFKSGNPSVAEWVLLKAIGGRQKVPLREIHLKAGLSRQRMRKVISELKAKNFLTVERSETDDKRAQLISATPQGINMLTSISVSLQGMVGEAVGEKRSQGLVRSARTLDQLSRALRRAKSAKAKDEQADDDDGED